MTGALHGQDMVELYEMLEMIADWIDHDTAQLRVSLDRFIGGGYTLEEFRADLARFIFLLGGPGDRLLHGPIP
jgi:hypothetical protein